MSATEETPTEHTGPTRARDVMTAKVVSVGPEMPIRDIASLLLDNHISAVPFLDSGNVPIGMVSEGDLVGRVGEDRVARIDWWLALVTGRQPLDDTFQARVRAKNQTANDVMSAPLVTVTEDTEVSEIARLFTIHHIKRVPVVRDGRVVGIVSRANLLRVIAAGQSTAAASRAEKHKGFIASLFGEYHLPAWETVEGIRSSQPTPKPDEARLAADDFRRLVTDFHGGEMEHKEEARRSAANQRREQAKRLIDAHVFDEGWSLLMHRARVAAENGESEFMLLQFPNQLCIDGGRAINVHEKDWPATLRGRPAEICLRWERELKPQKFTLSARVMEYPDGKPGDIGLFLVWED